MKFKIGQRVRVVKKIRYWGRTGWAGKMNQTIGKIYQVVAIDDKLGYQLNTRINSHGYPNNYWYPEESLSAVVGEQLVFPFMEM